MIQIKRHNIDKLANDHYESVKNTLKFDDIKTTELGKKSKDHRILIRYLEKHARDLIIAKPSTLRDHIMKIETIIGVNKLTKHPNRGAGSLTTYQEEENEFIRELEKVFNYDKIKDKANFAQKLNITCCPYCNREYIFEFEDASKSGEVRILAHLDHYYDKATYPFLGLSFFNLIPSCHTCNSKFKLTANFFRRSHLHPYEDDFNTRAIFKQSFILPADKGRDDDLFSKDCISLKIIPNNALDLKTLRTIRTFRLQPLYNQHKDVVVELLQKRTIYSDTYIDELLSEYEGKLFKNREDLLRIITCGYIADDDIDKRPLSKLIKDISKQLEFI